MISPVDNDNGVFPLNLDCLNVKKKINNKRRATRQFGALKCPVWKKPAYLMGYYLTVIPMNLEDTRYMNLIKGS